MTEKEKAPGKGGHSQHAPTHLTNFPPGCPEPLRIPDNYVLRGTGVCKLVIKKSKGEETTVEVPISLEPVLITKRMVDRDTKSTFLTVAWRRKGKWVSTTQSRDVFMDPKKLIGLAAIGFPVYGRVASELAEYLAYLENYNLAHLATGNTSGTMGWHGDGFLCGHSWIGDEAKSFEFKALDNGDDQLADGLHGRGNPREWLKAFDIIAKYPRVEIGIYAALLPPMLEKLNVPNFVLDWSHKTSAGKSSALQIAASVWGCPKPNDPRSIVSSWDSTKTYVERAVSTRNHLPIFLDESKKARVLRGQSVVPETVYTIANGHGRTRASLQGVRRTIYFRTVALSTGEMPLVSFSKDGGLATRVVTITKPPWGEQSNEAARDIRAIRRVIESNYGHMGPKWVQALQDAKPETLARWSDKFDETRARFEELLHGAQDVGASERVAEYLAALAVCREWACEALGLPSQVDCVELVAQDQVAMLGATDRTKDALAYIASWAQGNENSFHGREGEKTPSTWAGVWPHNWTHLCLFKHVLAQALEKGGFNSAEVLPQWRDNGWLNTEGDLVTARYRHGGQRFRCVQIKRHAVEEMLGMDKETEEDSEKVADIRTTEQDDLFPRDKESPRLKHPEPHSGSKSRQFPDYAGFTADPEDH